MTSSLEVLLKTLIKDAICEALDELRTTISAAAEVPSVPAADPGVRTKRKAKEAEVTILPGGGTGMIATIIAADPASEYKKIQQAVVALVNQPGGKDKVVKILDQFCVPTALKLTAVQYPEALSLLEQAMNEEALA